MIKLYEELVKLSMVCMQNTIQGEGLELFIKPRLGGGGGGGISFTLPRSWLYERPQANGLGRGTEKGQANSLPGRRGFHY